MSRHAVAIKSEHALDGMWDCCVQVTCYVLSNGILRPGRRWAITQTWIIHNCDSLCGDAKACTRMPKLHTAHASKALVVAARQTEDVQLRPFAHERSHGGGEEHRLVVWVRGDEQRTAAADGQAHYFPRGGDKFIQGFLNLMCVCVCMCCATASLCVGGEHAACCAA